MEGDTQKFEPSREAPEKIPEVQPPARGGIRRLLGLVPGFLLAAAVAACGIVLSEWVGTAVFSLEKTPVSGIMLAIAIGLLVGNLVALPAAFSSGIRFCLKKVLRLGIIFLGIRLSFSEALQLGVLGIPVILMCVIAGLAVSGLMGLRLKIGPRLCALIAVGSSICGATAIVATGPLILAREEEITYAVANVTLFGLLAMLVYPFLANLLFADFPVQAGLFLGTAIHETAQVAGAGLIYSELYRDPQVLAVATVTKLVRNVLMIAVIPLVALRFGRDQRSQSRGSVFELFPAFVFGFFAMALVRTVGEEVFQEGAQLWFLGAGGWRAAVDALNLTAEICLAVAMAAVGLQTRFSTMCGLGIKPFYVGFVAALSIGLISLAGVTILFRLFH